MDLCTIKFKKRKIKNIKNTEELNPYLLTLTSPFSH